MICFGDNIYYCIIIYHVTAEAENYWLRWKRRKDDGLSDNVYVYNKNNVDKAVNADPKLVFLYKKKDFLFQEIFFSLIIITGNDFNLSEIQEHILVCFRSLVINFSVCI